MGTGSGDRSWGRPSSEARSLFGRPMSGVDGGATGTVGWKFRGGLGPQLGAVTPLGCGGLGAFTPPGFEGVPGACPGAEGPGSGLCGRKL